MTRRGPFCPTTLIWLWTVFIFVFFSASHSKLPAYILPIIPALAILVAPVMAHARRTAWSAYGLSMLLGATMLAAAATGSSWLPSEEFEMVHALLPWVMAGGGIILATALVCCFFPSRRLTTTVAVSAAWLIATRIVITGGAATLAPWYSTVALAQAVTRYNRPGVPVYSVDGYQQTLPFYLGRTMTLVSYQGELAFGIKHARESLSGRYLPSVQAFAKAWQHDARGLAFAPRSAMPAIRKLHVRFRVVARNPLWVAFVPEAQS